MKYYYTIDSDQGSASHTEQQRNTVHFLYKKELPTVGYKVSSIPLKRPPDDINRFGYLFVDDEQGTIGIVFRGKKVREFDNADNQEDRGRQPLQQDRIFISELTDEWEKLSASEKEKMLMDTLMTLGEALVDADDIDDSLAQDSGSTAVINMIDHRGVTLASVGDSMSFSIVLKLDGRLGIHLINQPHGITVDRLELLRNLAAQQRKKDPATLLLSSFRDPVPKEYGLGTICGRSTLSSALGNYDSHEAGIPYTPDVTHIAYTDKRIMGAEPVDELSMYHPELGDQLFLMSCSDGLTNCTLLTEEEKKEVGYQTSVYRKLECYDEIDNVYLKEVEKNKEEAYINKVNAYEAMNTKKFKKIIQIYHTVLKQALSAIPWDTPVNEKSLIIAQAFANELARRNGYDMGSLGDNYCMTIVPAGPEMGSAVVSITLDGNGIGDETTDYILAQFPEQLHLYVKKGLAIHSSLPHSRLQALRDEGSGGSPVNAGTPTSLDSPNVRDKSSPF